MKMAVLVTILNVSVLLAATVVVVYLISLTIRALRKYLAAEPVRKEKTRQAKNLGQVLKEHRVRCRMTQEFVAESLGVSRQAVSKWESGKSDPSTTNLMALARLYGVPAEDLLREVV